MSNKTFKITNEKLEFIDKNKDDRKILIFEKENNFIRVAGSNHYYNHVDFTVFRLEKNDISTLITYLQGLEKQLTCT